MHTLKKFIKYYGPYKAVFFIDLLCATIISLVDLAYPQILRSLTKTLFVGEAKQILSALGPIAALLFAAYVLQTLCKYYVTYAGHMMGARMERDMRKELFDHYEKLSFSYYDQHNSGQMMSKLVSDLFDISELAHHGPFYFSDQDCGIVPVFVCDQLETGDSDAGARSCYADFFLWAEPQNAGDVHGQPQKNRRYQFQSAGYIVRYSCGAVVCK